MASTSGGCNDRGPRVILDEFLSVTCATFHRPRLALSRVMLPPKCCSWTECLGGECIATIYMYVCVEKKLYGYSASLSVYWKERLAV